jgi:class 3 adenylate cyclase/tetratricopeptide (TPR) repeat protein
MGTNEQTTDGPGRLASSGVPGVAEAGTGNSRTGSISLPSERKLVTILFADIVDSTKLIEALDPEEAADRLGPLIRAMVSGIHQYGGTVIRSEGDAILALFGAPHAYEDHAVRACHSAIAILRRVAELNDPALNLRVALNSGEVMVRPVVRDVSVEYEVTGVPMHVASRVEKLAKPGMIYATRATIQLVEGLVNATRLGHFTMKGMSEPVELFEVSSSPLSSAPWDARLALGLTPFVGRGFEKNVLWNAAESARTGRGQLIEIIGDAGVGKSRLVYELANAPIPADYTLLIGETASYAQNYPYFSFRNLFKKVFAIASQDDDAAAGEKLSAKLSADPSLASLIPAFRSLLGLVVTDPAWMQVDPLERRRLIIAAARDFILGLAKDNPVICVLEDLQWMDDESRATVEYLVRSIDNVKILVCVTTRGGSASLGEDVGYYTRIPIHPLDETDAVGMLDHLMGDVQNPRDLKRLIVSKAQGNPLFLEELARMLSVSVAAREPDLPSAPLPQIDFQVPSTVQSVIAARIDRLPTREKEVLQVASVIGGDVPASVLRRLTGLDDATLETALTFLGTAKFLFNSKLPPEGEYSFYHALAQEVAYRSLLKERRRKLHAAACSVFADLHAERIDQVVELLAHHAELGALWEQAALYLRQASAKAIERSAYKEAIGFLERALDALGHLPETQLRAEMAIDLRLTLRIGLGATGDYRRLYEHLSLAEQEAILIDDGPRLGAISTAKTHVLNMLGDIGEAISNGLRARDLAGANRDSDLALMANYFLAQAHEFHGDYGAAVELLTGDLPDLRRTHRHTRFGMTGTNSILHLSLLSHSQAYRGAFLEAEMHAREACAIAEETGRPYDVGVAHFGDGIVKICRGRIEEAIASLDVGLKSCEAAGISALLPMISGRLGFAYAIDGQVEKAAALLDFARLESAGAVHVHGWSLAFSGWVEYQRGAATTGLARQHQAVQLAKHHGYRGMEVWALWLLGTMLRGSGRFGEARAVLKDAIVLAKSLEMRLHYAYCNEALAEVSGRLGQSDESCEARVEAERVLEHSGALGRLTLQA